MTTTLIMYQSVDDDIDIEDVDETPRRGSRGWLILVILAGILVLAATIFYVSLRDDGASLPDPLVVAERQDYLSALSETDLALRRARLTDFVKTYPKSRSRLPAQAQLDVLNEREAEDWARLSNLMYTPDLGAFEKEQALDAYARVWGPSLLGGREDDIARLKETYSPDTIETEEDEETPDFTPPADTFSDKVSDTNMAGAAITRPRGYVRPQPRPVTPKVEQPRVVEPKIRRNVIPRYPTRAVRREVEALVVLSLDIDAKGEVITTELVSIEARRYQRDFIKAAERAALKTEFFPKTINGTPVRSDGVIKRYRFTLD